MINNKCRIMYSKKQKKVIKYFILFCAMLGIIIGAIAGYKVGKKEHLNDSVKIENDYEKR
jgi:ABC-type dipeptide/oligopeptide/nickel transport system permease subunit